MGVSLRKHFGLALTDVYSTHGSYDPGRHDGNLDFTSGTYIYPFSTSPAFAKFSILEACQI